MPDKYQKKRSTESDQTKEQHAHLNRSRHDATLLNPGPPALYRLNTERKYIDGTDRKVRQWTYGRRDRNKQNKVILMVGETGSGKTTMINTMINYLLGVKFDDQEFYQITEEEEEDQDQSQSQTSEITVYEAFAEENPTSLTIINTPGYGGTEGDEKDEEISENLTRLFSDKDDGIRYIDAVCFVMKASQNRLSGKELYIFHSVLSLFGRDIENNIVFLLTQSDGGPPTDALNAINTAEIPCRRDEDNKPVHFLFNNRQKQKRDKQYYHLYRSAWGMGKRNMNRFFTLLEEENRKSVEQTVAVLKERRRLEACVSNLKDRIDEKSKMNELTQIQEALRQNRDKIEKCENFEFTVKRVFKEKVPIVNEWWWNSKATCCSVCEENCHERCWWVSSSNHSQCSVMRNNHCTVCSGKCHYSKHVKEDKKYVLKTKEVIMTFAELKQEYERTGDQNEADFDKEKYEICKKEIEESKNKIEEQLKSVLEKNKEEKSKLLHEAYTTIMSLCEISLKADSAFTLLHLDFLIPRLKEEGKDEWMKKLEDLRKAGEERKNKRAINHVRVLMNRFTDPFNSKMSDTMNLHLIGGKGGHPFSFTGQNNGASLEKIGVWVGGSQVKAVRVWLSDGRVETFGVGSGPYQEYKFTPGECFTSLSLWANGAGTRLGAIKFKTSLGREFFAKVTSRSLKTEYPMDVGSGYCLGVVGRGGSNIDCMGFVFLKAVESIVLTDVHYPPTVDQLIPQVAVEEIKSLSFRNNSSTTQKQTIESSKKITKTSSWSVSGSLSATFSMEVKAGVPMVAEVSAGYSVTIGVESTYGHENTDERTETMTTDVDVPPGKKMHVSITIGRATFDMPYTGTVKMTCKNGSVFEYATKGTYKGVTYTDIKVETKESPL